MSSFSSKNSVRTCKRRRLRRSYLELLAAGITVSEAAHRLGISDRTVQRLRAELGLQGNPPAPRITAEELRQMEALLDDGWSYREIERHTGHDQQTVARHFPGRGWTPHQAGTYARMLDQLKRIELGG